MANPKIYQQIEASSDFYDPSIYASALTYHHSFASEPDQLSAQFVPLTSAKPNPQLFVIGLIPPSATITGRRLDRSRSVAALAGGGGQDLGEYRLTGVSTDTESQLIVAPVSGNLGANQGPPVISHLSKQQIAAAMQEAFRAQNGHNPTVAELEMYTAQSLVETSGNWPNNNPAGLGNRTANDPILAKRHTWLVTRKNKDGSTEPRYFFSYNTPAEGAKGFLGNLEADTKEAARSGDPRAYAVALKGQKRGAYYEEPVDQYARALEIQLNEVRRAGVVSGIPNASPPPQINLVSKDGDSNKINPGGAWQGSGSSNANASQKQIAKGATVNLNNTELGQRFAAAQARIANQLQLNLEAMANTPPLRMLINPQSFKVNSEQTITDGNWSRHGPIIEHWAEGQDKLEASGRIGAFFAADALNSNGPGMTRTARNFSASYQNFLSLYHLYRNNAGIFLPDDADTISGQKMNLAMAGSIYIYYDHTLYIGSFDSFTITETDSAPFTLEYNYSFTVRATFMLDAVEDSRYTYGMTSLNVNQPGPPNLLPTREPVTNIRQDQVVLTASEAASLRDQRNRE